MVKCRPGLSAVSTVLGIYWVRDWKGPGAQVERSVIQIVAGYFIDWAILAPTQWLSLYGILFTDNVSLVEDLKLNLLDDREFDKTLRELV